MRPTSRAAVLLASLLLALPALPAGAQETFIIPRDEGYGIAECLTAGAACAHTVADAWCAAMGQGPSISFGLTEDETGSIEKAAVKTKDTGFRVTCG